MKLPTLLLTSISFSTFLASTAMADMFEVTITNITAGQVLTPPVVITHDSSVKLFTLGQAAPDYLIPIAEDGDISGLSGIDSHAAISDVEMASAAIMPGGSVTLTVETTQDFPLISLAGMLATSNDAFVALNGSTLDFNNSSMSLYANVYDAGSEANTEDCQFIPGPPCGNGSVRDTDNAEGFVHIHSGIHGIKDLQASQYDWNNPGVHVSITRK